MLLGLSILTLQVTVCWWRPLQLESTLTERVRHDAMVRPRLHLLCLVAWYIDDSVPKPLPLQDAAHVLFRLHDRWKRGWPCGDQTLAAGDGVPDDFYVGQSVCTLSVGVPTFDERRHCALLMLLIVSSEELKTIR
jgi:hypothetical protein